MIGTYEWILLVSLAQITPAPASPAAEPFGFELQSEVVPVEETEPASALPAADNGAMPARLGPGQAKPRALEPAGAEPAEPAPLEVTEVETAEEMPAGPAPSTRRSQPTIAPTKVVPRATPGSTAAAAPTAGSQPASKSQPTYRGFVEPVAHTEAAPAATRDRNAELVAELFAPAATTNPQAQPLKLTTLLSRVTDRGSQIEAVTAYWQLAVQRAELAQRHRELEQLQQLSEQAGQNRPDPRSATQLHAALTATQVAIGESELQVTAAEQALAARIGMSTSGPIIPVDLPHAGSYQTHFAKLYPAGQAPSQALMLDKTLPLRKQAVEARVAAVRASQDHYEATHADYLQGQATLTAVLEASRDIGIQQRTLLRSVYLYNRNIAEYALPIARPATSPPTLVGMLIKLPVMAKANPPVRPQSRTSAAAPTLPKGIAVPAAQEPAATAAATPAQPRAVSREATAANAVIPATVFPTTVIPAAAIEVRPQRAAPAASGVQPSPNNMARSGPGGGWTARKTNTDVVDVQALPAEDQTVESPAVEPNADAFFATQSAQEPTLAEPEQEPKLIRSRIDSQVQPAGLQEAVPQPKSTAPKSAQPQPNSGAAMGRLAEQLAAWYRTSNNPQAKTVTLAECLSRATPGQRAAVATAYWRTLEETARMQAQATACDQVKVAQPIAMALRQTPTGPRAMLLWRMHQTDSAADLLDIQLDQLQAQAQLAQATGLTVATPVRPADAAVVPAQIPTSTVLAKRYHLLSQRAEAVGASAAASQAALQIERPTFAELEAALVQIDRHTAATFALLAAVSDYQRRSGWVPRS